MTNFEKIKSMSIEEMIEFLSDFEVGDIDYGKGFCPSGLCDSNDCDKCLEWWLNRDAQLIQGLEYGK